MTTAKKENAESKPTQGGEPDSLSEPSLPSSSGKKLKLKPTITGSGMSTKGGGVGIRLSLGYEIVVSDDDE